MSTLPPTFRRQLELYILRKIEEPESRSLLAKIEERPPSPTLARWLASVTNNPRLSVELRTELLPAWYLGALSLAEAEGTPHILLTQLEMAINLTAPEAGSEYHQLTFPPEAPKTARNAQRARKAARKRQRLARRQTRR